MLVVNKQTNKTLLANAGDVKRCRSDPRVSKIPWRRAWQPTLVFLLGEPHGQRSLIGYIYSPWGGKESNTTEQLSITHISKYTEGNKNKQ